MERLSFVLLDVTEANNKIKITKLNLGLSSNPINFSLVLFFFLCSFVLCPQRGGYYSGLSSFTRMSQELPVDKISSRGMWLVHITLGILVHGDAVVVSDVIS